MTTEVQSAHCLRRIVVARVAAADLFREDVRVVDGIPDDAEVKSTYLDPDTDSIVFIVQSSSFEPVKERATIPRLDLEVEAVEPERQRNAQVINEVERADG
ncbi:hypothetical protein C500_21135 [Natrialba magadii ATCC 43099]|nr:hypothetical protein [Natrialba magadii]ELY23009.1 hypothetical protein C500_21135 [Natrialba magadii ATCC 43099]